MKYLILTNDKLDADKLNKELYKISRPDSKRDPKDVTTELYDIIEHPATGDLAFAIPDEEEETFVYSGKNTKELSKLYKKYWSNKDDKVKNNLDKVSQGKIKMKNILPFEDLVDQTTMEANGWFEPVKN